MICEIFQASPLPGLSAKVPGKQNFTFASPKRGTNGQREVNSPRPKDVALDSPAEGHAAPAILVASLVPANGTKYTEEIWRKKYLAP
jgi:hypothetical protein